MLQNRLLKLHGGALSLDSSSRQHIWLHFLRVTNLPGPGMQTPSNNRSSVDLTNGEAAQLRLEFKVFRRLILKHPLNRAHDV